MRDVTSFKNKVKKMKEKRVVRDLWMRKMRRVRMWTMETNLMRMQRRKKSLMQSGGREI